MWFAQDACGHDFERWILPLRPRWLVCRRAGLGSFYAHRRRPPLVFITERYAVDFTFSFILPTYLDYLLFEDSKNQPLEWYVCSRTTVSLNYNYPEQCQITLTLTLQLTTLCGILFHPVFHKSISLQVPGTQLPRRRRGHGDSRNGGKYRRCVLRTTLVLGHSNDAARSRRGACSTTADDLLESGRAG